MKIIEYKDLNFSNLKKLDVNSYESTIYYDEDNIYKIFKENVKGLELMLKEHFLKTIENYTLKDVILPQAVIKDNDDLKGYSAPYIKNAKDLTSFIDNKGLFQTLTFNASKSLKNNIHAYKELAFGDINFGNILIDKNYNNYFCDFDSCKMPDKPNLTSSSSYYNYLTQTKIIKTFSSTYNPFKALFTYKYQNDRYSVKLPKSIIATHKNDRIAMMLQFFEYILNTYFEDISIYQYDEAAEQYETLKNMRKYFLKLKKAQYILLDVPYLYELISYNDIQEYSRILK